jgi:AAA domain
MIMTDTEKGAVKASVKNSEFLQMLYSGIPDKSSLWVTSFYGNPDLTDSGNWFGRPYRPDRHALVDSMVTVNSYFSVAALSPTADGEIRRRKANFEQILVLVADDALIDDIKGTVSYVLNTSPGKAQIGIFIDKDDPDAKNRNLVDSIVTRMAENGLLRADASGNNSVRYVRLPVGQNQKPRETGPWDHQLAVWNADCVLSLADAAAVFGIDVDELRKIKEAAPADSKSSIYDGQADLLRLTASNIVRGERLHESINEMAFSLVACGTHPGTVVSTLRGLMESSLVAKDDRWKARYDDIPRSVTTAVEKLKDKQINDPDASTPAGRGKSEIIERLKSWKPADTAQVTEIREIKYYVEGLIQSHLAGSLVSQGGTGKTSILMLLGIETALGGAWFGMAVTQGAFVLLSLDDAQEDLDACFAMILREKAFTAVQVEIIRANVRLISLRSMKMSIKFAQKDGQSFMSTGLDQALIEGLSEIPNLRCVALDTLRQFAGGTTNDDQLVTVATKAITSVADACGCAAIVNHHGTKQGAREGVVDQYSGAGSGALADNLRFVLNLSTVKTEDARKMLNFSVLDDFALDHGSVVLELVDTRGSLLRRTIDPVYIMRDGYRFTTLETSKKTPAQRNMEKFKQVAKIIKDKGPQSRNALFAVLKGKKQEFLEMINGWQNDGLLVPLGTGSSSVIDLTKAGKASVKGAF